MTVIIYFIAMFEMIRIVNWLAFAETVLSYKSNPHDNVCRFDDCLKNGMKGMLHTKTVHKRPCNTYHTQEKTPNTKECKYIYKYRTTVFNLTSTYGFRSARFLSVETAIVLTYDFLPVQCCIFSFSH